MRRYNPDLGRNALIVFNEKKDFWTLDEAQVKTEILNRLIKELAGDEKAERLDLRTIAPRREVLVSSLLSLVYTINPQLRADTAELYGTFRNAYQKFEVGDLLAESEAS